MPSAKRKLLKYAKRCLIAGHSITDVMLDHEIDLYMVVSGYRSIARDEWFGDLTPDQSALFILLVIEAEGMK